MSINIDDTSQILFEDCIIGNMKFDADTGNAVVLVSNVSFESNIGVEVVVIADSQNIEFTDCRFIQNQVTLISFHFTG